MSLFNDILAQSQDDDAYLKEEWEDLAYSLESLFDDYNIDLYDIIDTPVNTRYDLISKGLGATRIENGKPHVYFSPIITDEEQTDGRTACGAIVHEMIHVAAWYIDNKLSHEDTWLKMANDKRLAKLNIKEFCKDI